MTTWNDPQENRPDIAAEVAKIKDPLRVFDLFAPGRPDPVTQAEVTAHHAAQGQGTELARRIREAAAKAWPEPEREAEAG